MNKDKNSVANANVVKKLHMIGYSHRSGALYGMRDTHEGCGCLVTTVRGRATCTHCGHLNPTIDRREMS